MFLLLLLNIFLPIRANAAGNVRFGSNSYAPNKGANFNVGVYVGNNEDNGLLVGDYSVTLTYDAAAITYISGGAAGGNGSVTVSGTSPDGKESMHMLSFKAEKAGATTLSVASAAVNDTTGTPMEPAPLISVTIDIQGGVTTPPEYILLNGKQIPGFAAGRTEYTFSIPYADDLTIEAPEGYNLNTAARQLKVGRNEITVSVSNNDGAPIDYVLHVNMEKNKNEEKASEEEKTSEDASEEASEKASEKAEKTSEKVEKASEESASDHLIPPMSETVPVKDKGASLLSEKKSIIILFGFGALILVIVGIKFIIDGILASQGRRSDLKNLRTKDRLAKQEKVDEAASPFQYDSIEGASIEPKKQVKSNVDLRLKTVERDKAKDKSNAPKVGADGKPIPKLDFSKRKSASRMAREEMAANATTVGDMTEEDVADYIESLDTNPVIAEEDLLDLDEVSERESRH